MLHPAIPTEYPAPIILHPPRHTHPCNPQAGKIIIIPGTDGSLLLPSVVSFLENGRVAVGQDAVDLLERHPASTIYGAKRFIGRE